MRVGLDIGSTTIKCVVLNDAEQIVYSTYERHYSHILEKGKELLHRAAQNYLPDGRAKLAISGSAGMGLADSCKVPFVQEVFATRVAANKLAPGTDCIIELGGEDAKILFLTNGTEVRMNGSCAGGTGAFIDQMATLLKMSADEIMDYINRYLPEDIGVIQIQEMPERFHSRLNAVGKTYRYRIWNSTFRCIFERRYVYELPQKLDLEAMREAASYCIGKHDFRAFTSNKKSKKSTVRTIEAIQIERIGEEVVLTYRGDGSLYHMVRILTGTLIEVGLGQRNPSEMEMLLSRGSRDMAGALAPAKGLALMEVRY